MAAIDIGTTISDRSNAKAPGYTYVVKGNPANGSGTITSIEMWANVGMSGCEIATFYVVSGNNLSTRDTLTLANISAGEHSISNGNPITVDSESNPISLTVQTGDYIGIYYSAGKIEVDYSGGSGIWDGGSNDRIPCTNVTFINRSAYEISLCGTGITGNGATYNYFGYNST